MNRSSLVQGIRFSDILVGQQRAVTKYMVRANTQGNAGMTRLKEKTGNFSNGLSALHKYQNDDPKGAHTNETTKSTART